MGWLQTNFVEPVRGKLRRDHSNAEGTLSEYQWKLRYLVPAYTVLDQLRVLRNFATHPYDDFRSEREASVALHAMLYLFQIIASSGVFT